MAPFRLRNLPSVVINDFPFQAELSIILLLSLSMRSTAVYNCPVEAERSHSSIYYFNSVVYVALFQAEQSIVLLLFLSMPSTAVYNQAEQSIVTYVQCLSSGLCNLFHSSCTFAMPLSQATQSTYCCSHMPLSRPRLS